MDRRAWRATVHRVAKSWTRLSDQHTRIHNKQRQLVFIDTRNVKIPFFWPPRYFTVGSQSPTQGSNPGHGNESWHPNHKATRQLHV